MTKSKISIIISALFASQIMPAQAAQPDADSLIGNIYGGIHGAYLEADDDRLEGTNEELDNVIGLGLEAGYRLSAPLEFRLSYTHFNADLENGIDINGINKYSLDALYFPTHKNVYLLGGVNGFDFDADVEAAVNLGIGYRHYFTNQLATYIEGKANFQFDESYTDGIARIGLVYFFGHNSSQSVISTPVNAVKKELETKSKEIVTAVVDVIDIDKDGVPDNRDNCLTTPENNKVDKMGCTIVEVVDADNDGVIDSEDKCLTTPANDKVNAMGCTTFAEENLSYRLSVNFDSNKAVVKPQYFQEIKEVSDFLNKYPHVEITIDGYTSIKGSASYNKKLSQQRADAIVDLLVDKYNIDSSRMKAMGHGENNLIDTRDTAEAHQANRRIEVNVKEN